MGTRFARGFATKTDNARFQSREFMNTLMNGVPSLTLYIAVVIHWKAVLSTHIGWIQTRIVSWLLALHRGRAHERLPQRHHRRWHLLCPCSNCVHSDQPLQLHTGVSLPLAQIV